MELDTQYCDGCAALVEFCDLWQLSASKNVNIVQLNTKTIYI